MRGRAALTAIAVVWSTIAVAQAPEEKPTPEVRDEQRPFGAEAAKPSKVDVFGYVKVGYFFTGPASNDALVGSNSGFRLANLRMGVSFQPVEKLAIVASVDGSVAKRQELDPLTGSRVVELRDAYVEWDASRFMILRAGQYKAPFNAESLLGDGALPFVSRSIITDGAFPPDAFPVEGMSLGRQVGVGLESHRIGEGSIGLKYALAVVNGNGANVLNNDNNLVTPVARLVLELGEVFAVGVNAYYDLGTFGARPARLTEERLGAGADVAVNLGPLHLLGVGIWRSTRHPSTALPAETGLGAMGQLSYLHPSGFEGGGRFAFYEPSTAQTSDQQMEIAAMLGYRAAFFPGRFILQYTVRLEEAAASVSNNSVDALLQVSF